MAVGGKVVGALTLATVRAHRAWPDELVQRLRLVGEIFANALVRKQKELEIQEAFRQIKELNQQLEADCTYLREEIDYNYDLHQIIGQSHPLKSVLFNIQQIAATDTTVLILGETGTGKELVARAIHAASHRRDRPMVKVNCAALPANLIESELFGHEKGAFTSAQARQIGRFELADRNTLFLDEIGELPLESQAKLLRVLQEGEFERLGSSRTIKVDVRILAATNRNLEEEVRQGRFRQDLWYRLNVFPITAPPLRQRREDIPLLVNLFVSKFSRKMGKKIERIPSAVLRALQHYDWPGNVRELENVIERAVINTGGLSLQLRDDLKNSLAPGMTAGPRQTLEEVERGHIVQVLEETRGRIEGSQGAALILGINPSTLRSRMRKLGIQVKTVVD
ncbi:MAG: sigma 54-interacting transcriptional regulator [Desulfuromonadales bacterium]|nr:sigma 54-interacting transcriptional regulator [Desulfuromonadales bacterium]